MSAPELPHKPRRGERLQVRIAALDERGDGVARFEAVVGPQRAPMRFDVHVRRAVPGDLVEVEVGKTYRRRIEARAVAVLEPAVDRVSPRCAHFADTAMRPGCGGCTLQTLDLSAQRAHKQARLRALFTAHGVDPELVEAPVGAGDGWYYRNKMEFSFAGRDGAVGLGMHPAGFRYEVIDHRECLLMSPFAAELVPRTARWAAEQGVPAFRGEEGFWRSLVVREGKNTAERMLELVTSHHEPGPGEAAAVARRWADWSREAFGEAVTSLFWTQIRTVRGEPTRRVEHHLGGRPTLREQLTVAGATLQFEIAPSAFFQTNTAGAELLYSLVAEHAAPSGSEAVLDLYSGTGTIALCLAPAAKSVLGIELVPAAVENARANAALNGIDNVEFIAGDVGAVLTERSPQADVVVVDPPRAGLMPQAHTELARIQAERLVYVSCNPEALARDLATLSPRWQIERVRPVDMFPQTAHIETVVSLRRRD